MPFMPPHLIIFKMDPGKDGYIYQRLHFETRFKMNLNIVCVFDSESVCIYVTEVIDLLAFLFNPINTGFLLLLFFIIYALNMLVVSFAH